MQVQLLQKVLAASARCMSTEGYTSACLIGVSRATRARQLHSISLDEGSREDVLIYVM